MLQILTSPCFKSARTPLTPGMLAPDHTKLGLFSQFLSSFAGIFFVITAYDSQRTRRDVFILLTSAFPSANSFYPDYFWVQILNMASRWAYRRPDLTNRASVFKSHSGEGGSGVEGQENLAILFLSFLISPRRTYGKKKL